MYPNSRPRRLRVNHAIRSLVQEHHLSVNDFIVPLFVVEGTSVREEIESMPGQFRLSIDQLISRTVRFVPIHGVNPTSKRYIDATVFVDPFSEFTYLHLMTELNSKSLVEAKWTLERFAG